MKSLRGRDCWPLLGIDDALLDDLRANYAAGMSPNEMISWLHDREVTKPGATLALRLTGVMPVADTKIAVHLHPSYAYRREADEAFHESVVAALEELNRSEAA